MTGSRTRFGGVFLAGLLVAALPGMGVTASEAELAQRAPASSGSPLPEDALALRPSGTSLGASLAQGAEALRSDISRALGDIAAAAASPSAVSAGSDGRLTVLLLGSDYRTGYRYTEHTDVMMVASLDLATKRLAMASIPRDVAYFPVHPDNRSGTAKDSGALRVNLLYDGYKRQADGVIERTALDKFRKDVAFALGMEIDYYAYLRFSGFDALMDNVGGVSVDIPARIVDPNYQDSASPPFGIQFPTAYGWNLRGWAAKRCSGTAMNCKRGIVYVRSRKGTVGSAANSDAQRVRRQQGLVLAAIRKVASGGADLSSLRSASLSHVTTSLPTGWEDVSWLRSKLAGAIAYSSDRIVFVPPSYAKVLTYPKDSSKLKNRAVRGWVGSHMD
jgi:anionic cell wall polymer biosynthesis LytR-Cps2A-Psr (LCP) family protein